MDSLVQADNANCQSEDGGEGLRPDQTCREDLRAQLKNAQALYALVLLYSNLQIILGRLLHKAKSAQMGKLVVRV